MFVVDGKNFQGLWRSHWPNQRAFAEDAGVSPNVVVRADNDRPMRKGPCEQLLVAIADKLNTTLEDIKKRVNFRVAAPSASDDLPSGRPLPIPVISGSSAGRGWDEGTNFWADEALPGELYPFPDQEPLGLRVEGVSMAFPGDSRSLNPGDVVIFANRKEESVPEGGLAVVLDQLDNEKFVKLIHYPNADEIELRSLNPEVGPQRLPRERVILRPVKISVRNWWRTK